LHRFSHVAVTLPASQIEGGAREELLRVYHEVLGWSENPSLSIPGQRLLLRAPTDTQYITIRASESPMQTSGYEHLGVLMDTEAELRATHARADALAATFPDMELQPIQSKYGDALFFFRLRFRLPLTLEVQHIRKERERAA
jgi:hypothetical protein